MNNSVTVSICLFLLVAACEAANAPNRDSSTDHDVTKGHVRIFEVGCMKEVANMEASPKRDLIEVLAINDMTTDTFCNCQARTIFESMTQDELDQLWSDASEGPVYEQARWITRSDRAAQRCALGVWPE